MILKRKFSCKTVEEETSSGTVEWGTSIAEATAQSVETGKPIMMKKTVEEETSSGTVEWGTSIAEATAQSVETGKPIMMDFYTEW